MNVCLLWMRNRGQKCDDGRIKKNWEEMGFFLCFCGTHSNGKLYFQNFSFSIWYYTSPSIYPCICLSRFDWMLCYCAWEYNFFHAINIFQLGVKTSNTKQPRSTIVGWRHRVTTATTFGYIYNNEANIKLSSGRTCGNVKEADSSGSGSHMESRLTGRQAKRKNNGSIR